jgi:hypothetical protein
MVFSEISSTAFSAAVPLGVSSLPQRGTRVLSGRGSTLVGVPIRAGQPSSDQLPSSGNSDRTASTPTHSSGLRRTVSTVPSSVSRGHDNKLRLVKIPGGGRQPSTSRSDYRRPTVELDDVSPLDSVSNAPWSHGRRPAPYAASPQEAARARLNSAELIGTLGQATSRASPAIRRRMSESKPEPAYAPPNPFLPETSVRLAPHTGDIKRQSSRGPRDSTRFNAVPVSTPSITSKLVIDKDVLGSMAGTTVMDDINLRMVKGHNVVVLRDGASLEVVDEEGNYIFPTVREGPGARRSMGLPPVTPRDLHDRLKAGANGNYNVSRSKDGNITVLPASVAPSLDRRNAGSAHWGLDRLLTGGKGSSWT